MTDSTSWGPFTNETLEAVEMAYDLKCLLYKQWGQSQIPRAHINARWAWWPTCRDMESLEQARQTTSVSSEFNWEKGQMRLEEDILHIQAANCILHILKATHIKIIFNLDFFYSMCIIVLVSCLSMHYICAVPIESRRGHQIPWEWSYRWLLATMWMLRTEPMSPGKAVSTVLLSTEPSLYPPTTHWISF